MPQIDTCPGSWYCGQTHCSNRRIKPGSCLLFNEPVENRSGLSLPGLQPHGVGVVENMIKEAGEEAGIPEALAQQARPVGAVSYAATAKAGQAFVRDVLFTFDLELPDDFTPVASDGEVDSFELLHVNEVMEIVAFTDRYKTNCNLVLIEFFFRHGLLDPAAPGYLELLAALRQSGVCS